MDAKALTVLALQVAIFATVFGYGLKATREDVLYLFQRPGLALRSFLSVLVVMPVLVVAAIKIVDLPQATEVILVALAISPVPPLLLKRETKAGGHASYGVALMLVLGVAAIVAVPLALGVLQHVFDRSLAISPLAVAKIVGILVVCPLLAGLLLTGLLPSVSKLIEAPVRWSANGLLIAGALVLLAGNWRAIGQAADGGTFLAVVAFICTGLLLGHLLAARKADHAAVLGLATACRHPGIALAVAAANFPGQAFVGTLLLYLLASLVLCIPFVRWERSRVAAELRASRGT